MRMPSLARRYLPILSWGAQYSRQTFTSDLIVAGIVTVMLIPQSLAYAMLAGLPPQMGPDPVALTRSRHTAPPAVSRARLSGWTRSLGARGALLADRDARRGAHRFDHVVGDPGVQQFVRRIARQQFTMHLQVATDGRVVAAVAQPDLALAAPGEHA